MLSLWNVMAVRRRPAAPSHDPLAVEHWTTTGYQWGGIANPSPGVLRVGPPGQTRTAMALIYNPQADLTNARIRAKMTFSGWAVDVDQPSFGPGGRIAGTETVLDWRAVYASVRRFDSAAANANTNLRLNERNGSTLTNVYQSSGLGASTSTQTVVVECEFSGTSGTSRLYQSDGTTLINSGSGTLTVTGAGKVGFFGELPAGVTCDITSFEITPL